MIPPGSTIGIIGGGQLGRMLAIAAANLGYRASIYAPESSGPAAEVSARWVQGAYDDVASLTAFANSVDVVTYEFENIPVGPLDALNVPLAPNPRALEIAQDRAMEKQFVVKLGGQPAPWAVVSSMEDFGHALGKTGAPAILKTRRFGYDGKGQARLRSAFDAETAWNAIGRQPAVLEGFIHFDREFSLIAVRGRDGTIHFWDPVLNVHDDGILARSTVPAEGVSIETAAAAAELAASIMEELDYVGVLAIEFFDTLDGPIFNEMAPRVHNSGHWTIEGSVTSQFENHIRAVCGLPLGSTARAASSVEMRNLIGAQADEWPEILADPTAHLHLYGKTQGRPGRKMGHVTRLFFD